VLTLVAGAAECLWDEALPVEVRELPVDLAALDGLLSDPELWAPIEALWRREFEQTGRLVLTDGRPTIAMETYVRGPSSNGAWGGESVETAAFSTGGGSIEHSRDAGESARCS